MKDAKYLRWIRMQPCIFEGDACDGPVCAHHATGAGLARKADDRHTMPLCHAHHMQRHDHTGVFYKLTKAERKQWEAEMVEKYQALYDGGEETF